MSARGSTTKRATTKSVVQTTSRRWGGAKRTRLNRESWRSFSQNNTINQDLIDFRDIIVARSKWEAANNGFIRGMIETWVTDVVGEGGPTLQVQSESGDFNNWLENEWGQWWSRPDLNGQLTGADFLDLDERSGWDQGESINQIVPDEAGDRLWPMALVAIDSNRLSTTVSRAGGGVGVGNSVVLGVERTPLGKNVRYWVMDTLDGVTLSQIPRPIPAEQIIHLFETFEADQARGVPRLAPVLDVLSSLRSFNSETMTAARTAARHTALLETTSTDAEFVDMDATADINEGEWATIPPGWKVSQLQAAHPNTTYQMFVDERLREIGCVAGMPLMRVKLDASGHNYSSARFDDQLYQRRVVKRRGFLSRNKLGRLITWMLRDRLRAGAPVKAPKGGVQFLWAWQPFPHVDPLKEAQAAMVRLAAGTSTLSDEIAVGGRDLESHIAAMARVYAAFDAAGVPVPEWGGAALLMAQQVGVVPDAKSPNEDGSEPLSPRGAVVAAARGVKRLSREQIARVSKAAKADARRAQQPVEIIQRVTWDKPRFSKGVA